MDFFDGLGAKLTQTGQKTKKMASTLVDTAKLTTQITDLNKSVQELYAKLGDQYYLLHGGEPEEALGELCAQIKGKLEEAELLKADLQRLKNVRVCPQCGYENTSDANFCAQCSAQLPELPKRPEPQEVFCPSCGSKLAPGAHFCTKCGTKLD